jgi:hypothetical protein
VAEVPDPPENSHRRISFYVAIAWLVGFGAWTIWYVITWILGWRSIPLAYHRLPSVVGIPFAMLAAFVVVAILEQTSGPIQLTGADFSFKGAAGQVLFWLLVFLSIVYAIHLLWPLTVDAQSNT